MVSSPPEDEQLEGPDDLLVGDRPALDLGVQHRVDDVAARRLASALLGEVPDPLGQAGPARRRVRVVRDAGLRRQVGDVVDVVGRRVEREVEERRRGIRPREHGHEVALAGLDELVDESRHERAGAVLPLRDDSPR